MPSSSQDRWKVDAGSSLIYPSRAYVERVGQWYCDYRENDPVLRFQFQQCFTSGDEFVHRSRLKFQGGPFAAVIEGDFMEKNENMVVLPFEDDPDTFKIIRNFLYCKDIQLEGISITGLVRAIRSAHRWDLGALFEELCLYLQKKDLLGEDHPLDVLRTVDVVSLPNVPFLFERYFWDCVAKNFDHFTESSDDACEDDNSNRSHECAKKPEKLGESPEVTLKLLPVEQRLNPLFPKLWELAGESWATSVLSHIAKNSKVRAEDLMDLVLQYLEPRFEDDDDVLELIKLLPNVRYNLILQDPTVDGTCSTRAIRLLALVEVERIEKQLRKSVDAGRVRKRRVGTH